MTFLILVGVAAIAYFAWRIVDQLPDIVYRLSEIQRDVADLRRQLGNAAVGSDSDASPLPGPTAADAASAETEAASSNETPGSTAS